MKEGSRPCARHPMTATGKNRDLIVNGGDKREIAGIQKISKRTRVLRQLEGNNRE